MRIHIHQRSIKLLAADVLKVDINTIRSEPRQGIKGALLLVVEATVEAELLGDEIQLGVGPDGANDLQAQLLGDLADDLAHGARGRAHEDGLALLRPADLLQARVGRQARHAEGAQEHAEVEVRRVLELLHAVHARGARRDDPVLGDGEEGLDELALGVVRVPGLEDPRDGGVHDGLADLERRRVRLHLGVAHAAPEIRVVRGVQVLDQEAALGGCGARYVEGLVLHYEVLAWFGHTCWDGLFGR